MKRASSRLPSPSLVISILALVAALAGTAWAAGLAANSVKSKTIKDGQVKSPDLQDGGVAAADILDGGVAGAEIADNAVKGADVDEASLGVVPSATVANHVHATFKDGPLDIFGGPGTQAISGVALPAGTFAISAKIMVENSVSTHDVKCLLILEGTVDEARVSTAGRFSTMSLQIVHTLTAPQAAVLHCGDDAGGNTDDKASFIKITAVQAAGLTNLPAS